MAKKLDSRAVKRTIPAGIFERCTHCDGLITWETGKRRSFLVIANVYRGRRGHRVWDRLEYFHLSCYERWKPYGELQNPPAVVKQKQVSAEIEAPS